MKTIKMAIVTSCVLLCSFSIFAQMHNERPSKHCFVQNKVHDLSPEQEAKIETIELTHLKKMQQLRNTKHELQAHLQTLETAETSSLDAINKQIDQIGAAQISIMKERAAFRQQIRTLLTDKQRIMFDLAIQNNRCDQGHKHGMGKHRGKHWQGGMHRDDDMNSETTTPEK